MSFDSKNALSVFKQLLSCGTTLFYWEYSENGELLYTTSSNLLFNKILKETIEFSDLISRPAFSDCPILLSSEFGIQWSASIAPNSIGGKTVHLIGPTFATAFSSTDLENLVKNANVPLSARKIMKDTISSIPVFPTVILYQYSLMLHYCVTGQKLDRSQIVSMAVIPKESVYYKELKKHLVQEHHSLAANNAARRKKTYEFERKLLSNVRTGNMDYQKDLNTAGFISEGVNLSLSNPSQRIHTSGIVFITLCTRAAIEGGLTPDMAYTLGDKYIDKLNHTRIVSEAKDILDDMYKTFITEVNFIRRNSNTNHQILDIMNYIESFPGEDLSLDTLSKRVGYTSEHLSRKFKAETGQTLSAYIRKIRLDKAKELLTSSELKISDISNAIGYDSPSLFSSYFYEEIGMTPSEYREKYYLL